MIRRTTKIFFEVVGFIAAGVAILVAVAAWQFSRGPISIDFLTPYLEAALAAPDGRLRVKLDHTYLAWEGWSRTVDLRSTQVRAYDATGRLIATVPEVALKLSGFALFRELVAPSTIDVVNAHVKLRRAASGEFELNFQAAEAPASPGSGASGSGAVAASVAAGAADMLPILVAQLMQPPDPTKPTGYLRRVRVLDSDLHVEDSHWDVAWKARLQRLVLERDAVGIKGNAALDVVVGDATTHFEVIGNYVDAARSVMLDMDFTNLQPALFAHATPLLEPVGRLKLPLDGSLAATVGVKGEVGKVRFHIMGGEGTVAAPEIYPQDVKVSHLEARGAFDPGEGSLTLEDSELDIGGPIITISGAAKGLYGNSQASLELSLKGMPVDDLQQRWPERLAVNARRWIVANLTGGQVDALHLTGAVHGHGMDPASVVLDKLNGTMKVDGVTVHYLGKLPKVHKVGGDITFDDKTFNIKLDRGTAEGLNLEEASILISGLNVADQSIAIDFVLRGPLRSALKVIDYEPLGYASALGVDPEKASGQVAVRTLLQFPLMKDLHLAQIKIAAAANMTDVVLAKVFLGHDLEKSDLKLNIDKAGMQLVGKGLVGPVPVTLDWRETFGNDLQRRIEIKGEFDAAARRLFNFDTAPMVTGPVGVTLDLGAADRKTQTQQLELTLDLNKAELQMPRFDWHKPAGPPGKAHLVLLLKGDRVQALQSFELEAEDLHAEGSASFMPNSAAATLEHINFTRFDFGKNKLAGTLALRPEGGYDVVLKGDSLDISGLIKDMTKGTPQPETPAAEKPPPLTLELDLRKVWLTANHKEPLLSVKGTLQHDGSQIVGASLAGHGPDDQLVTCTVTPSADGRLLTVASNDAGLVLRAFDIVDNVVGGKLDAHAEIMDTKPGVPIKGVFRMEKFQLIRAPFLVKTLTLASLTGIVDQMGGQGVNMSVLNAPFVKLGDKIDVTEGRTVGSELGITFDGQIDLARHSIDFAGTIVPVYTLNSLLGKIPGVGTLLVGSPNSGVFAASYRATGDLDDPDVNVNPLSPFAPGILRGVINLLGGPPPAKMDAVPSANPPNQRPF